jgi:hypothetical protein
MKKMFSIVNEKAHEYVDYASEEENQRRFCDWFIQKIDTITTAKTPYALAAAYVMWLGMQATNLI